VTHCWYNHAVTVYHACNYC